MTSAKILFHILLNLFDVKILARESLLRRVNGIALAFRIVGERKGNEIFREVEMPGELPFFALPVQDCAAQLGERQDFLHCPYIRLIFPLTAQVKRAFCVVKAAVFAVSQLVRQLVGLIGGGLDLRVYPEINDERE